MISHATSGPIHPVGWVRLEPREVTDVRRRLDEAVAAGLDIDVQVQGDEIRIAFRPPPADADCAWVQVTTPPGLTRVWNDE